MHRLHRPGAAMPRFLLLCFVGLFAVSPLRASEEVPPDLDPDIPKTISICSECPPTLIHPGYGQACQETGDPVLCWMAGGPPLGPVVAPGVFPPPMAWGAGITPSPGSVSCNCLCCVCFIFTFPTGDCLPSDPNEGDPGQGEEPGQGEPGGGEPGGGEPGGGEPGGGEPGGGEPGNPLCPCDVFVGVEVQCNVSAQSTWEECWFYDICRICIPLPPLPCIDDDLDGECVWSDPDEDAQELPDEYEDYRDADGDGIPDKYDTDPSPYSDGKPNKQGLLPNGFVTAFLNAKNYDFEDLDIEDFAATGTLDVNGDGYITLGEAHMAVEMNFADTRGETPGDEPNGIPDGIDRMREEGRTNSEIQEYMREAVQVANEFREEIYGAEPINAGAYDLYVTAVLSIGGTAETITTLDVFAEVGGEGASEVVSRIRELVAAGSTTAELPEDVMVRIVYDNGEASIEFVVVVDGEERPFGLEPPNPSGRSEVGDPVSTYSGGFHHTVRDVIQSGRGIDLMLERHYQSYRSENSILGSGWSMPLLETRLIFWPGVRGQFVDLLWGDGNRARYELAEFADGEEYYEGVEGSFGKIRFLYGAEAEEPGCERPIGGFVLRQPDGTLYYFCPTAYVGDGKGLGIARLRKICDPYGNCIVLQRSAWGYVHTIIDSLRREYTLEYNSDTYLLESITDFEGRVTSYAYSEVAPDPANSSAEPYQVLRSVTYPETQYLNDAGVVDVANPVESYHYSDHDSGAKLTEVLRNGTSKVIVNYHDDTDPYQEGKVRETILDGLAVLHEYEELTGDLDELGQKPISVCRVTSPEGEVRKFYHGEAGVLLRSEILGNLVGSDASSDADYQRFLTLYEYSEDDRLVIEKVQSSAQLFDAGQVRRETFEYDSTNPDRFQQRNLIRVTNHGLPNATGDVPTRVTDIVYDPITAHRSQVRQEGTVIHQAFYTHQESAASDLDNAFGVAGFEVSLATDWDMGDLNADGALGGLRQELGVEFATYEPAQVWDGSPTVIPADVASDAQVPPGLPVRVYQHDNHGRTIRFRDEALVWTDRKYKKGYLSELTTDSTGTPLVETFQYDDAGRVTENVKATGEVWRMHYGVGTRLQAMHQVPPGSDDKSIIHEMLFDLDGNEVAKVNPSYSSGFDPSAQGDQPRVDSRRAFNSLGHLVSVTKVIRFEGAEKLATWTFEQDSMGRTVASTNPRGQRTEWRHDSRGNLVQRRELDPSGNLLSQGDWEYNDHGERIASVFFLDRDGNGERERTSFTYTEFGEAKEVISPSGQRMVYEYDDRGRPTITSTYSAVGSLVARTQIVRDSLDRVSSVFRDNLGVRSDGTSYALTPSVVETVFTYGDRPSVVATETVLAGTESRVTTFEHDRLGRRTAEYLGAGTTLGREYSHDVAGRVTSMRVLNGIPEGGTEVDVSEWLFQRNGLGQVAESIDPFGESTFIEYDAEGRVVLRENPAGDVVEYEYDSLGQQRGKIETGHDGLTRQFAYGYDLVGSLTYFDDAKAQRTTFEHDFLNRMTKRVRPNGQETEFVYDQEGLLTDVVELNDPTGRQRQFLYDVERRREGLVALGASASVVRLYSYDSLNRLVGGLEQVAGGTIVVAEREYSSLGNLLEESQTVQGLPASVFSLSHNALGGVTQCTYPTGLTVDFEYDSVGRLEGIDTAAGMSICTPSDPFGFRGFRSVELGIGGTVRTTFDPVGRKLSFALEASPNSEPIGFGYEYDVLGNLVGRTRNADSRVEEFDYDGFSRLAEWRFDTGSGGVPARTVSWEHDPANNVSRYVDSLTGVDTNPAAGLLNEYTQYDDCSQVTYTAVGEEESRTCNNQTINWLWDALGRPVRADSTSGAQVYAIQWLHDPFDREVLSVESDGTIRTTAYLRGRALVETRNGVSTEFVPGPHGLWKRTSTGESVLVRDPFRNVVGVWDGTSVLEGYDYDPFGSARDWVSGAPVAPSGNANDRLFLGKRYYSDLGLHRVGARLYDADRGRFVSTDPLGLSAGQNLYSYAFQNPFRWFDPSGLEPLSGEVDPTVGTNGARAIDWDAFPGTRDGFVRRATFQWGFPGEEEILSTHDFDRMTNEERLYVARTWLEQIFDEGGRDNPADQPTIEFIENFIHNLEAGAFISDLVGVDIDVEDLLAVREGVKDGLELASNLPGPVGTAAGIASGAIELWDTGNPTSLATSVLPGGSSSRGARRTSQRANVNGTNAPSASTAANSSQDVKVIGRQDDTAVAADWDGHDVLNDPNWSRDRNDAWVQEGIDNQQDFYTASPREGNMVQTEGPFAGEETIFARELNQLEAAGYVPDGDFMRHPANAGGGGN